ncbi:unnamed protein product [Prorocentrum cordatum]|uniref:Uncharacterized protein n=1 Tax=Prorocentrum cordatum TaxID=2364126 RepID=A0ABN9TZJ7_9DINO|nr:unnamed protein product [Polarella glacialis]
MAPADVLAASTAAQAACGAAVAVMDLGAGDAAGGGGARRGPWHPCAGRRCGRLGPRGRYQEAVGLVREGLGGARTVRNAREKRQEIGHPSKARKWSAHPGARIFVRDVAKTVKNGSASGCESQSTVEADLSEKTELMDTAAEQSEKADDCSKEASVGKFLERELADKAFSLKPVALQEGKIIKADIKLYPECKANQVVEDLVPDMLESDVLVLNNSRLHKSGKTTNGSEQMGAPTKKDFKGDPRCKATDEVEETVSAISVGDELALVSAGFHMETTSDPKVAVLQEKAEFDCEVFLAQMFMDKGSEGGVYMGDVVTTLERDGVELELAASFMASERFHDFHGVVGEWTFRALR